MAAELDLQQGLYDLLSVLPDLVALGVTVTDFGRRRQNAATGYPYVEIGQAFLGPWDSDTSQGYDAMVRINTWSDSDGAAETKRIQGIIYDALHRQPCALGGVEAVELYRSRSFVQMTPKGSFHGVCEYRGLIDHV